MWPQEVPEEDLADFLAPFVNEVILVAEHAKYHPDQANDQVELDEKEARGDVIYCV